VQVTKPYLKTGNGQHTFVAGFEAEKIWCLRR